jgi:hypothetical protein
MNNDNKPFGANHVPVGTVQQGREGEFILVSVERCDIPLRVPACFICVFILWYAYAVFRHESRWGPLARAKRWYSKVIVSLVVAWGIAATTHFCARVTERIGTHMSREAYYTLLVLVIIAAGVLNYLKRFVNCEQPPGTLRG